MGFECGNPKPNKLQEFPTRGDRRSQPRPTPDLAWTGMLDTPGWGLRWFFAFFRVFVGGTTSTPACPYMNPLPSLWKKTRKNTEESSQASRSFDKTERYRRQVPFFPADLGSLDNSLLLKVQEIRPGPLQPAK